MSYRHSFLVVAKPCRIQSLITDGYVLLKQYVRNKEDSSHLFYTFFYLFCQKFVFKSCLLKPCIHGCIEKGTCTCSILMILGGFFSLKF